MCSLLCYLCLNKTVFPGFFPSHFLRCFPAVDAQQVQPCPTPCTPIQFTLSVSLSSSHANMALTSLIAYYLYSSSRADSVSRVQHSGCYQRALHEYLVNRWVFYPGPALSLSSLCLWTRTGSSWVCSQDKMEGQPIRRVTTKSSNLGKSPANALRQSGISFFPAS